MHSRRSAAAGAGTHSAQVSNDKTENNCSDQNDSHVAESSALDRFFLSQPCFVHDRTLPPEQSIERLLKQCGMTRKEETGKQLLKHYYKAFVSDFYKRFGPMERLDAFQGLCRQLGIPDAKIPETITLSEGM